MPVARNRAGTGDNGAGSTAQPGEDHDPHRDHRWGPAGYEAALVAAQLDAEVTVIERDGIGGASVLTDCVPSKTFIAAAGAMTRSATPPSRPARARAGDRRAGPAAVNHRVKGLALAQSADIQTRLAARGRPSMAGQGRLADDMRGHAAHRSRSLDADGR